MAEDFVEYIVQYTLKTCQRDITALEKIKRPFYCVSYTEAVDWLVKNDIPLIKKIDGEDVEIRPFPWCEDFGAVQEEAFKWYLELRRFGSVPPADSSS